MYVKKAGVNQHCIHFEAGKYTVPEAIKRFKKQMLREYGCCVVDISVHFSEHVDTVCGTRVEG